MSYSRVADHRRMVFDEQRNGAYARAIHRHIAAGSVVMDLGAGLGLHGLVAARAGAGVYLVEPEPVVLRAIDAAQAAGVADRVTLVRERIEDAKINDRVDAVISVFTGNLLFSEDLLPSLFFARDKFLKPGGLLLPDRGQLWVAPVHAPALHEKYVATWSRPTQGIDYSAARMEAANEIIGLRRDDLAGSRRLAAAGALVDLDFHRATTADCDASARLTVGTEGTCHGLLAWTRIKLGDEWLSTDPTELEVHWSAIFLPVDPPLPLAEGEQLEVKLLRPAFGDWTWTLQAAAGKRRHSTFLSRSDGPRELARAAPGARPGLNASGAQARRALQLLGGGASVDEIATAIAAEFSLSKAESLREVQALARRYGGGAA